MHGELDIQIRHRLIEAVADAAKLAGELRESGRRLNALLDASSEAIFLLTPSGDVLAVNAAGARRLAGSTAEMIGRSLFSYFPADLAESRQSRLRQVVESGAPAHFFDSRADIHFENTLVPVKDDVGQVESIAVFAKDITKEKTMRDRLARSEASLLEAQELAQTGSWEYELAGGELSWSDQIYRILELDPTRVRPSIKALLDVIDPDERSSLILALRRGIGNFRPYEATLQLHLRDGSVKHVQLRAKTLFDRNGRPFRSVGTLQDVTLQVIQEMAFRESEERFRTIADYTYDWEYWLGVDREVLYISPSCKRITGYTATEFVSNPALFEQIVHPDDRELFMAHKRDADGQPDGELIFRIVSKEGQVRWIAHGCRAVFSANGAPRGRRISNRDITDLKQAEQLAHQLAYYDSLTGLPNRRLLMDRLLHALVQATRFRRALAVMFLDLDRLKQVNDGLGHDAGDKLLAEVAARLTACMRQGDTVARTGGDEFVIVLPEISQPADAATLAEKIVAAVSGPVRLGEHVVDASVSVGIAVRPADGTDGADEMMLKADRAMYKAKQAGRNCYRLAD